MRLTKLLDTVYYSLSKISVDLENHVVKILFCFILKGFPGTFVEIDIQFFQFHGEIIGPKPRIDFGSAVVELKLIGLN